MKNMFGKVKNTTADKEFSKLMTDAENIFSDYINDSKSRDDIIAELSETIGKMEKLEGYRPKNYFE